MKNVIIYFFIITFIFSFSYLEQFDSVNEANQIEELLNKRIDIINAFLYGDKDLEKLEKLEKDLSKIEDEKLLKTDIDILTHIYHNPTDYERTTKVKINKVKEIQVTKNSVKMLANLQWTILANGDLPIETSLIKDYNISCVFKDKKMYLTNMEFVK
ncbi:MAG TPA: hypothetical protein DC000_04155 [Clostridiales bacterium]|nr:hypothetical protein [Clostridiales bacterium]